MIDFRYHLVSIVAVFLALAVGIVVGATALKPLTTAALDRTSKVEQRQIRSLQAENGTLKSQASNDQTFGEAFAKAAAPRLLSNLLTDQRVVIVTAPGADGSTVSGITSALQQAGAKVTGQVQLQPAFFGTSASTQNSLNTLAQQLAPLGGTPAGQATPLGTDTQIAGQREAGQVITDALVTTGTDLSAGAAKTIISGFKQAGYIQVNGTTALAQATLAVVVIPAAPPQAGDVDPQNLALIALAQQLAEASHGAVLAGSQPGSGSGSAIDELINGNTGIQLSSVDNANTESGQILVAWALSESLAKQKTAAYGLYTGVVPTPAPTQPAPTPTAPATTAPPKTRSAG